MSIHGRTGNSLVSFTVIARSTDILRGIDSVDSNYNFGINSMCFLSTDAGHKFGTFKIKL